MGGSPGLVVMGRDSHSVGHGFESRHRILDGHFSHVCLKRPKINEKEACVGLFFLKKTTKSCSAFIAFLYRAYV